MTPVIYRGTPEVLTALLSGQVSLTFDGVLGYLQNVQPGQQLKMLAVNSAKRLAVAPNVPSFAEIGYSKLVTPSTFGGIVVRAGTPREIVNILHDAIVAANTDPKVVDAVVKSGGFPITSTPEEFDEMVKACAQVWGEVIRAASIRLDP
jgi:tripartite-type tricarboxylate transporter receptor subunit TctC